MMRGAWLPGFGPLLLLPALLLSACVAHVPERYTGTLTRTSGSCASSHATLVLRGSTVSFAPTDGAQILPGTVGADGHVLVSLTTQGANGKPFVQELEGNLTPTMFTGHFRSPFCRADVALAAK